LDKPTLTFTTTSTQTLTAMVAPSNASNKNVTWTSSNTSVATVVDGVVTPVGNGAATITVQTADGNFTAACNVTVAYAVTGVSLNTSTLNFTATTTQALSVTVAPDNAANKNVTWSSSNAGIATVSNGVVTPIANGTATITVTTIDGGYSAACAVTVNILVPVTGVSLDKSTLTFTSLASTQALIATVAPATATNKSVIWSSNNTNVATVSNGVVTPVGCGEAIITVRTADGNKTATCMVNVSYIVPKGVYSGSTVLDAPNRITSSEVINNYGFHPTGQDLELYPTDFNTDHLSFTWDEAQTACAAMGWRLPNLAELANLQSNNAYLNYGLQRSVYVTSNVFDGQRAWTWRHSRQANVFKYHKQSEISETE
jgi:uncharacterized protein YjdB